jgi:hypothetical protein
MFNLLLTHIYVDDFSYIDSLLLFLTYTLKDVYIYTCQTKTEGVQSDGYVCRLVSLAKSAAKYLWTGKVVSGLTSSVKPLLVFVISKHLAGTRSGAAGRMWKEEATNS